jgi:ferrous iron transport protein B
MYSQDIEAEIAHLEVAIKTVPELATRYCPRWLAVQLLEGDQSLLAKAKSSENWTTVELALTESLGRLDAVYGEDVDVALADHRYGFVNGLVRRTVTRPPEPRISFSDKVDRVVTHRLLGIPIFLTLMWVVFKFTAEVATPFLDWIDGLISGPLAKWGVALLSLVGLGGTWVESLFVDGIIAGVGGVLVFIPVLMSLYLALAVLEDSGYMARAAIVMHRLMNAIGLHGKSFLPMIVGFGCTVPALYATRTLEDEKDRILTGLLVPFMSCGARLPVYVLFAAVFFPAVAGMVIFSMYLLGIVTAIVIGLLLKNTLFRSAEPAPFVMELPPYRMPSFRGIWSQMWERTWDFVRNAWTIILAISIVLWFLLAMPAPRSEGTFAETNVNNSVFATISGAIAPVFAPLGFGTWEASGSLMTGFVAKEVVIASMAQIYGVAEAEEEARTTTFLEDVAEIATSFGQAIWDTIKSIPLIVGINLFEDQDEPEQTELMTNIEVSFESSSGGYGALAGLAFMVFVLLYTPCMVAVAAERHEFGAKWMWFTIIGQFIVAWLMAFIVFQGGKLLLGWLGLG